MLDIRSIATGLELGEDGIWYSSVDEDVSYSPDGNQACFSVEDQSFWFEHRNNCIASVVKSFPPENGGTIFDIGGGNGFVALGLVEEGFDVALVEPGKFGAAKSKARGIRDVICATTDTAKFEQGSLPAVALFDVIEHIEDDLGFLRSIKGLMRQGGRLYATVPSYSFLWSAEDVLAGHFRRYALDDIGGVLEAAGFHVEFASYIFRFLPIPIFLLRTLPYRMGLAKMSARLNDTTRDHAVEHGTIVRVLAPLLKREIGILNNKKPMRFGGSCLIVAKNL